MTIRKLSKVLFLINAAQFLLGMGIVLALLLSILFPTEYLLYVSIGLLLLSSIMSLLCQFSINRYEKWNYRESMGQLEAFNRKLREQRHDYLNQLQVVYGLLELEAYEEARDYMRPVFKDIMKVNRALKTSQPAVNALLQAKIETAEKKGIDFYPEVSTQLDDLPMEPWELCKILGNLIDNAITALQEKQGEKKLVVGISESGESYRFSVHNNGPAIPEEMQKLIFQQGFTTKKEEGHGMGLAIVEAAVRQAGGKIRLRSSEEETVFTVLIPRKNGEKIRQKMSR